MTINKIFPETLNIKERYALTKSPKIQRMSDIVGSVISVKAYAVYTDEDKEGKSRVILSIMDQDGDVYATNSVSFAREFADIVSMCEQCDGLDLAEALSSIEIMSGTSKSGRTYLTCAMV